MYTLQRIRFPQSSDTTNLYIRWQDSAVTYDGFEGTAYFKHHGVLSLDTYFNSFYEREWTVHTSVKEVTLHLWLQGDFTLSLRRDFPNKKGEIVHEQVMQDCSAAEPVAIPITLQTKDPGRLHLDLRCTGTDGEFRGGFFGTERAPKHTVSLGVIICTFNKEEYVNRTVSTLITDEAFIEAGSKVFVVDNARTATLNNADHPNVRLIQNPNVGGAGGFSRGILEAQKEGCTHYLCMDDDIALDSECVSMLLPIFQYAKKELAISGTMLNMNDPHIVHEAGAQYNTLPYVEEEQPFNIRSLRQGYNLAEPVSLNRITVEERVDYGAFWFCAFSNNTVDMIGLPLPVFIRWDDAEYGLRMTRDNHIPMVPFPGIAVRHEPFHAKTTAWMDVYTLRNNLIVDAIHYPNLYTKHLVIKWVFLKCISFICTFKYDYVAANLLGLEQFLQGPEVLQNQNAEKLHTKNRKTCAKFHGERGLTAVENASLDSTKLHAPVRFRNWMEPIRGILLNGHLLPDILLKKKPAYIYDEFGEGFKVFRKKSAYVFHTHKPYTIREMDKKAARKLMWRWCTLSVKVLLTWKRTCSAWRKASTELSSTEFWERYIAVQSVHTSSTVTSSSCPKEHSSLVAA